MPKTAGNPPEAWNRLLLTILKGNHFDLRCLDSKTETARLGCLTTPSLWYSVNGSLSKGIYPCSRRLSPHLQGSILGGRRRSWGVARRPALAWLSGCHQLCSVSGSAFAMIPVTTSTCLEVNNRKPQLGGNLKVSQCH